MGIEQFLAEVGKLAAAALPVIPIIAGLVEFAKILGMPSEKAAPALSVILGVAFVVVVQVSATFPVIAPWVTAVVVGLVVGMSATGLYTIGARWAGK